MAHSDAVSVQRTGKRPGVGQALARLGDQTGAVARDACRWLADRPRLVLAAGLALGLITLVVLYVQVPWWLDGDRLRLLGARDQQQALDTDRVRLTQLLAGALVLAVLAALATRYTVGSDGRVGPRRARLREQLGSGDPEARLDAVWTAERLLRQPGRSQAGTADLLAAFVRDRAPGRARPVAGTAGTETAGTETAGAGPDGTAQDLRVRPAEAARRPATEIQAALTALGGRAGGDLPGVPDLRGTDLAGAHLGRAKLAEANLRGTVLRGADLAEAALGRARLDEADLREANLLGAALADAGLPGADLRRANLPEAAMAGADLGQAKLVSANLAQATLTRANLAGAALTRANLLETDLGRARLDGADLREANLLGADLRDAGLAGADLRRANLDAAVLQRANLLGADLRGANLYGADLRRANLPDADLRDATLAGADLRRANLLGAVLTGADLTGADLQDANLVGTDLRGVNLDGAVGLTTEQLQHAVTDEPAGLPAYLRRAATDPAADAADAAAPSEAP